MSRLFRSCIIPRPICSGICRHFTIPSAGTSKLKQLDSSTLTIFRKLGTPTPMPALKDLMFGQFFTDHFLEVDWDAQNGWHAPFVHPMQPLQLHPGASALHYGLEIFEGLKAFHADSGDIILFRPDRNASRFLKSALRMALPSFDEKAFVKLLAKLIEVDKRFIPQQDGYSLYIRPILFSTHSNLGVSKPESAKLVVVLSPCGPYFPKGFKPVKLLAQTQFFRAFPGGAGDCKVGGNYGPTIYPQSLGAQEGFDQLLWLFPAEGDYKISEAGTMNFFMLWMNEKGEKELVTPPLKDNLILPGVTRESILELTREWNEFKVSERDVFVKKDLVEGLRQNRVLEVFGAGTAAVVSPVNLIRFEDKDLEIPLDSSDKTAGSGPLAKRILNSIYDIQYGRIPHKWGMKLADLL